MPEIYEYRGVEDAVYAEILEDSSDNYETGEVKEIAGVAEIGKTTENSSGVHYYDNNPAVVITSTGADTLTLSLSVIPLHVLADINGQEYDKETGALIEGERKPKNFALGYKTKNTNSDYVYVWRYKGQFSIPDSTHKTEDNSTDANGQQITYTGISTIHKFTKTGKRAKSISVDVSKGLADVSTFFDEVTTPDTLKKVGG